MRSVGISGSVRLVVQEDVLSAAEAELENVLFFQFDVTARFDDLVVEIGPVGGALEDRKVDVAHSERFQGSPIVL